MAEKPAQEKTEKPTERRRQKALDEGQVARSQELNSAGIMLVGIFILSYMAFNSMSELTSLAKYIYNNLSSIDLSLTSIPGQTFGIVGFLTENFGIFFLSIFITGIIANLAQDKFKIHFSQKALSPKFSRINPIEGLKRIFSPDSLVELIKGILKLAIVGYIAYSILREHVVSNQFWVLHNVTVAEMMTFLGKLFIELGIKIGGVLFIMALFDFAYQKWRHEKKLKMTKQEVKEERKQHEGNPQIKSRMRSVQKEMSRNRMMADVPDATVVVTNPTFIAIAIKYEPKEKSDAPVIIAKGKRKIAEKIKKIAREHDVPIVENKPLARTLFKTTEIGMEIPPIFYQTVAEILAQIFKEKGNPLTGGNVNG
ncbi:MAG TPA: flagellar biosynthesis protein FlhB [bacterium]|nr:flagellar biosynthesis protein FlhB [bacterium]